MPSDATGEHIAPSLIAVKSPLRDHRTGIVPMMPTSMEGTTTKQGEM
jgi:hypothetical protein